MTRRRLPVYCCVRPGSKAGFCIGIRYYPAQGGFGLGQPLPDHVFGTTVEVARFGARFPAVLDIAGDNARGCRAQFEPLVARFQAQRGAQPSDVHFRTQAEAHPRRLLEQLRGVRALLKLFGEWGHGLRLGAFVLARAVGALRIFFARHPRALSPAISRTAGKRAPNLATSTVVPKTWSGSGWPRHESALGWIVSYTYAETRF